MVIICKLIITLFAQKNIIEKNFIEEYSAAVEKENKWINDTKLKVGRWIITSMIGKNSSIMGLDVSGIDSFL